MTKSNDCVICGLEIDIITSGDFEWSDGHNAEPVKEGRCCTECNNSVVIPTRLKENVVDKQIKKQLKERLEYSKIAHWILDESDDPIGEITWLLRSLYYGTYNKTGHSFHEHYGYVLEILNERELSEKK